MGRRRGVLLGCRRGAARVARGLSGLLHRPPQGVQQSVTPKRDARYPRLPLGDESLRRISAANPTGDLAIVAIARNEGPFLAEWLTFHRLVGVQRVYLYDNRSDDETRDVIAPFVRDGYVERIDWPLSSSSDPWGGTFIFQRVAYLHALEGFGDQWRWMAFIDVDEFLFPAEHPDLVSLLRDFEDVPALVAFWRMFGSAGWEDRPPTPIIEHLTRMAPFPTATNTKTIVQPRHVRRVYSPHAFDTTLGDQSALTERRVPYQLSDKLATLSPSAPGPASSDLLVLNHYVARSKVDTTVKAAMLGRSGLDHIAARRAKLIEAIERETIEDRAIHRFLPALHRELAALR